MEEEQELVAQRQRGGGGSGFVHCAARAIRVCPHQVLLRPTLTLMHRTPYCGIAELWCAMLSCLYLRAATAVRCAEAAIGSRSHPQHPQSADVQGQGVKEEASSGDERGRTTRGQARAAGGEYRHAVLRDELDEHWEEELEDEGEDGSGHGSGGGGHGSNSRGGQ